VVVAEFENRTDDPSLDHLGRTIAETLTQGLSEIGEIDLLPARPLDPASGKDLASAVRRLAEETGASLIVTGDYSPRDGGLRLQARVTAAETMRPLYGIDDISASRAFSEEIVEDFRQRVMGLTSVLHSLRPPRSFSVNLAAETWSLYFSEPPRYDALLEYRAAWGQFGKDYPRAFELFQRAVELDPGFVVADIALAVAYSNALQDTKAEEIYAKWESRPQELAFVPRSWLAYFQAILKGRNAEALQLVEELYRRLPDPQIGYLLGYGAVNANRPELAIETFASYLDEEKSNRGDTWAWSYWSVAYHQAGEYEQELALARRMSERYPQSLNIRLGEVRAMIALGEAEKLDRVLEEIEATPSSDVSPGDVLKVAAREMGAHGRPEESLRIANLAVDWYREKAAGDAAATRESRGLGDALYLAHQWREARSVFAAIAEDDPQDLHALGYLGVLAARLGEQDEALRISQRLAAWEDPYVRGRHAYWRVSIAAALGDRDEAVRYLRAAFAEGLRFSTNTTSYLHADMNLEPLRGYPPFDRLMAPKEHSASQ
jgi:tetratricopeptide (TPR) repeat protein